MTQHGDISRQVRAPGPSTCCGFSSKFEPLSRIVVPYPDRILYWRPHVCLKSRWFTGTATACCVVQPLVLLCPFPCKLPVHVQIRKSLNISTFPTPFLPPKKYSGFSSIYRYEIKQKKIRI